MAHLLLRKWFALALLALTAGAFAHAQAPTAAAGASALPSDVEDQASRLAWWGDLDSLEHLYEQVKLPGLYTSQGNVLINEFRRGTARAFATPKETGEAFAIQMDSLTLSWTQQRPHTPLVHWLRVQSLVTRAWEVRGGGFANTVAPRAWADFRRYLEAAVQHVANTSTVSLQDSSTYVQLLGAGRGLGWDTNQVEQLVAAGRQRNPDDLSLWHQLITSSLPKWGGSAVLVDRLIRRAADQHQERGDEIYARLYNAAADEDFSHSVFRDTAADWPRIRKGLRDSLQRWSDKARFWNQLAYLACLKEDRETLIEALDAIQNKPDLSQWGKNGRRVFESCQKLGRQG